MPRAPDRGTLQRPRMAAPALEVRNRMAAFGWGFMAIWLGMLVLFTFIMGRDGPHPSQPALLQQGVLAVFWIVGLTVAGHVLSQPCTSLSVAADGTATLARRTPLRREVETWPPGAIAAIEVRAGKDDEGDPYWRTLLVARDGAERLIREGRDPDDQRALAARLRAALGLEAA
jgi:hypothetical protein